MTTTPAQFVALLKEENVVDAMQLIKTTLAEQARAVVAKTNIEVAARFKLAEKKMVKEDDETDNDNNDGDGKSDGDSVAGDDDDDDLNEASAEVVNAYKAKIDKAVKGLKAGTANHKDLEFMYGILSGESADFPKAMVWVQSACKANGVDYKALYRDIQTQKKQNGK